MSREMEEKALEIIAVKNVDINLFKVCNYAGEYNTAIIRRRNYVKFLTEDEFNLIKNTQYRRK